MTNRKEQDDEKMMGTLEKIFNLAELLVQLKDGLLEITPDIQRELSHFGWYASEGITLHETLKVGIEARKGNQAKVDSFMVDLYRKKIPSITASLLTKYPERAAILSEGLKAHKQQMYYASTALFLAQADGICSGVLFKPGKNKKAVRNLVKKRQAPDYLEIFLTAIIEETAIDTPYPSKGKFGSLLNRHGVMHGIDTDYGTEINSLKAFSILAFVGTFLHRDLLKKKK